MLVVDDETRLTDLLQLELDVEGYDVEIAADGASGLIRAKTSPAPDLIILDWNLPDFSGIDICQRIRAGGLTTPILMLTGHDDITDRVTALDAGVDDYLIKPFELSELAARVKALAKRRSAQAQKLAVGPLVMDLSSKTASREGKTLNLSPTGWKLLELLMRESPSVVSRQKMENAIWSDADFPDSDVLKVHLYKLRQQVDKPFSTKLIETIATHGVAIRVPND